MEDSNINNTSWFLQGDDGTVYGPVDSATLKAWSLEGRIDTDNLLSQDQETWIEAADVPLLEMDWLARLEDDTRFGPFNLQLVPGLIENGLIPANAMLENRRTGEVRPAYMKSHDDDLFPDWDPNAGTPSSPPPDEPAPTAETGAPGAEAIPDAEEALPEEAAAQLFQEGGWPADEPSGVDEFKRVNDESDATVDLPDDETADRALPLSKRLEPLQRSATEARQQLIETRHDLQTLRTAHSVLEDEVQRLKDELSAATNARQKSEQQLLEQQDRAAAAETETENLKAQLDQMKDHYDRLQLENQNQFEKIDTLQATQLLNEQRFKRELTDLSDRAEAKTELLANAVRLLMRDTDLASRLKSIPATSNDDKQIEILQTAIGQLEQKLEHERLQARQRQASLMSAGQSSSLPGWLLFLAGVLLGTAIIGFAMKSCQRGTGKPPSSSTPPLAGLAPPDARTNNAAEREFALETTETLDLQPEVNPQHEGPVGQPADGTAVAIEWPTLSLPSASIQQAGQRLRIVFNEGLFSVSTRLTPAAQSALATLADQLHGTLNGHQLMIEGHTDATPIATGTSRYVDNFALGMARAEAVKEFLAQTGKIPPGAMRTSSAGESSPPFPNDNEGGRKRNRTAVLTLMAR